MTLDKITEDAIDRSAKLNYTLENTGNAEISSIVAEIKDGDTVVKRIDLSKEKLTDAVQSLDLFKDYKIATTMTYNRGEGDETSKLDDKPLRLELKKVEIKNIASTNLVKVNDDGTETPSDFMSEKPSDEDVKKMYLKITSRDNKVTRLAVDKIELVTEKEKELYKITATAQDLIQHVDPSKTRNEYIHYIEKPRPKVDNVYYNFKDLVDAMNADKNGTFKIGADLNATNVPTPFKQYVPGTFKGHLSSVDGKQYTIHNIARPLFDRIENGSVKNINLGNVDINMPWADGIAPVANMVKNATVEDIKVTGSVIANNNIAGIVNKLDRGANMRNVAFIGKLHAGGDKGQNLAGIVGEIWKGNLDKAFVNATITGKRAKAAGIVSVSSNGMDNYTVGREGSVRHSVAKGTIDIENPVDVGGFISTNWVLGAIEDNVSMMKVSKGEIFFGSHNIDVPTPFKQYVPGTFKGHLSSVDGKQYTIHNIARPLFDRIENGSVKNINLGNVDINMPWADGIAPVANMVKNATVEDIKVTGSVIANNNIAGIVNKLDRGANMRNVAFIGKLHAGGDKGQNLAGIVGEIWKGNLDKAFVNATITGKRAKAAGIVSVSSNGMDNYTVGREGSVRHSVAKGTIDIENPVDVGGFISTNWVLGAIEDNVSMMKVSKGEIFFGSHNIDDEDGYFSGNRLNRDYVVKDVSTGLSSYQRSKRISTISQVEADKKIESYGISADKYEIHDPIVNTLNRLTRKEDEYKSTQDYKVDRDLAYRNIEKLQPFYNKEWIVNQGNKLAEDSNLAKKEVLSVTGMKDGQFVTDLSDIDHVMIHYADKTKEIKAVHQKESKVAQVREYSIDGLSDIVYTPNMVDKNRNQLIKDIKDRLATVELISPEVRALMGNRDRAEENTEERKNGYIRDLYLEESFAETKANLDKLVKSLIENADHQLNSDEATMKALVKKVDENKAKIVMALTYLNRYYDIKYGDMTIKNLMMFKPDFYGKSVDLLDFLIRIGSSERNIKGDRTLDAYSDMIGGTIGKSELHGFLDYNMRLFTNDTDLNDWFIHAAKNVYVVEPKTTNPDFVNKRHRAFDGLNNGVHNRMILPLLTLKNAHMFLISTYNTMAYSSFEKYGKYTEESRNEFKKEIDKVAKGQQTYLDFWSRLALPNVRDRLLKSQNMVPTPVWDNQTYNGSPVGRRGFDSKGNPVAPIRELYGPTWRHHDRDWRMGAMASIFPNPNNDDKVLFMVTDMISQFGISAFTHETTHVNDRMLYFGGNSHREGTDVEAYAQGMLQTPDKSTGNGEYGALGLNMAYHRENDGDQWYNYNPDKLQTREDIDRYMKNYNEALMMLDHLEADAVLESGVSDINTKWFKKVDKAMRTIDNLNRLKAPNQWDKVRDLNEEEKAKKLSSINDLIDNNFMTKHGNPGNGIYRPEDFTPNSAYVNVNMMAGIYGGNTSDGAPGSLSFKHNAFRMWGYYGYENGFISYVSNKYKAEADKNNHGLLSDKLIINKVSQGNFKTLEEWKRHWYGEILVKAKKGFEAIDIDGTHISNYDELRTLFDKAVRKDLEGMSDPKIKDHFKNTVDLKSKVFKALLKNTDGFFNPLFK